MSPSRNLERKLARIAKRLRRIGVEDKHIPTLAKVVSEQSAMLARFSRCDVDEAEWAHLRRCTVDQAECPNKQCSAACWLGGRLDLQQTVVEAHDLLAPLGLRLRFVTVTHPSGEVPINELQNVSLKAIKVRHRRAFQALEHEGPLYVAGAIEASLEEGPDRHWSVHSHLVVATSASKKAIWKALRPGVPIPKNSKPVVMKPVRNLGNILSYSTKTEPAHKPPAAEGRRGFKNPLRGGKLDQDRVLYDLWLDRGGSARIIFRNLKRYRGGLKRTK